MRPYKDNKNFIGGWYIEDMSIVDRLNDYWENNLDNSIIGQTAGGYHPEWKDSIDMGDFECPPDLHTAYLSHVMDCWGEYAKLYPESDDTTLELTEFQLQQYEPGSKGYSLWHCERSNLPTSYRHAVFMTYLNDVTDGGHTEFKYYPDSSIQPEKGLTLIFPSDWIHTHRGMPSPTQTKRFVTGWIYYKRTFEIEGFMNA
jgi:prolyl 4-hydroxylase